MINISNKKRLAAFFYIIARDHLPIGDVQRYINMARTIGSRAVYTNQHLGAWADEMVDRLFAEPEFATPLNTNDNCKETLAVVERVGDESPGGDKIFAGEGTADHKLRK